MLYYDEMYNHLRKADKFLKQIITLFSPLYKKERLDIDQYVPVSLFTCLHSTSESILILLETQAVFDADVLLRTIMEGTIRFCYITSGSQEEINVKLNEYSVMQVEIDSLSDHYKAIETINVISKYSLNKTESFEVSVLSDKRVEELKSRYSSRQKNDLKTRWSYKNLLQSLANTDELFKWQLGTLSAYSFTSHLIHYDWEGLSQRQEQIFSSSVGLNDQYDYGHGVRILSNTLCFACFRAIYYKRLYQLNDSNIDTALLKLLDFINELDTINNRMIALDIERKQQ